MRFNGLKKYFDIHKTMFSVPFFKLQKQNFNSAAALSVPYNLITYTMSRNHCAKWITHVYENMI